MLLADCHLHTSFSGDSEALMEEMIERAVSLGLKRICFTDHLDRDYPPGQDPDQPSDINIFELDLPAYHRRFEELRFAYRGKIELCFGIELGLMESAYPAYHALLAEYPFDFVIGSSHLVNGMDPYYSPFWDGQKDTKEGIRLYFDSIFSHLSSYDGFDSYGHLDYIIRYAPRAASAPENNRGNRSYSYAEYADRLDAILSRLIETDKALEVNTGGYKYGLGVPNPQPEVLARYRELGGEKITVGSDAHAPEHMAFSFRACADLLAGLGFRYYTVYGRRKPEMWKL